MVRVLLVFALLVAGALYYVLSTAPKGADSATTDPQPAPPLQNADTPAPKAAPAENQPSPQIVAEAREHISTITAAPDSTISIEKADHFVTPEQLLQMPEQQVISSASIETVSPAVGVSDDSLSDDSGAQTFAVNPGVIASAPVAADAPATAGDDYVDNGNQIRLMELLNNPDETDKPLYYIHAVNDGDDQGLWGILQVGLTRTFADGIHLKGMNKTLYASIPELADEQINQRSSFLGVLLQNKVSSTYIYNYRSGILGDNPDLIAPGQQLIIVRFSEDELIRVYNHFVSQPQEP